MLNPECLNPKDVLAHLNSLGYHGISPQQLKEFLHDLKKLIKYEQKHAQALRECVENQLENLGPSDCTCECTCECTCPEYDDRSEKLSSNESYCESSTCVSPCPTSATYSSHNSERTQFKKSSTRNPTESDLPQTAHTSFIRPWNIQGYKEYLSKGKKNPDPVKLYHQYKEYWKHQNIPGESKHSELRWVIRNKMLGQEPHPRVVITNPKYFS